MHCGMIQLNDSEELHVNYMQLKADRNEMIWSNTMTSTKWNQTSLKKQTSMYNDVTPQYSVWNTRFSVYNFILVNEMRNATKD